MSGALVLLLSACGSGVEIRSSDVSPETRRQCQELVAALPDRVADQKSRPTEGSALGAAWGDPAIVLTCGVGRPADYDPLAGCQTVDGVDWYVPLDQVSDQSQDVVLTTIGRTPGVQLRVPASRRPPAAALVDLAGAVKAHSTSSQPCS